MKKFLTILAVIPSLCLPATGSESWSSSNPERYKSASFANAVWYETFSGSGEEPFTVEFCGGATGKVEIINAGGRSEAKALKTVKTNAAGYIIIRFKQHIPVKNGDKMQFNCFYRGKENHALYSRAMLRLQAAGQNNFKLFSFYPGINGGERLQEIIATPANTWERKFTQRKAENNVTFFEPVLIIAGAPSTAVWDDFYVENDNISAQNWNTFFNRRTPLDRSAEMISDEALNEIIAAEKDHTGKVTVIDGKSRLLIDGKITAPVIDGPYGAFVNGKNYSNAGDFGRINVNLCKVSLRLGQGSPAATYRGCWTGKDQLNIDGVIRQIRNALRLNPHARIILNFGLHPYYSFTSEYPEEVWIGRNGKPVLGTGIHINESLGGTPSQTIYPWPSYHSEVLIQQYKEQIAKIITELKRNGLSKFIVGLHIGGGHDNQMVTTHFDYSQPAQRAFRKFLREKYVTEDALRQAWHNDSITFDAVQAPYFRSNDDCLHSETEQPQIDFFHFSKTAGWRMADRIAEYARKLLDKDVFTMRWCMGAYAGNPGASMDIYDFLTYQKFDILVAQSPYNLRPPSSPSTQGLPFDSFHLHGKLYTNEFDIRTWNAAPVWEKEIMSITWGLMIDFPMWQAANRKLAGAMFAQDMGFWYLDMAPGWFNHPQLLDDIKDVAETGSQLFAMPPSKWHPDTAFVFDDDGMFLRNLPSPEWMFDITMLIQEQLYLLGASGVPFARYSLNDLMDNPELAKSFKVLVFGAMYHIDSRRQAFLDKLKNSNRTLIFLSGTGRLGGAKEGSTIEVGVTGRTKNHHVYAAEGMKFNVLSPWMNKKDVHPLAPAAWYDAMKIVYAIAQPGDRILARFAENNQPAILERVYPDWKAVYIGEAGGLSPDYFQHLVSQAGGYSIGDSGFQCKTNGNFMMVHCLKNSKTNFKLPFKATVTNLANGTIHQGVTEIPVDAEAGATYWFVLKPASR